MKILHLESRQPTRTPFVSALRFAGAEVEEIAPGLGPLPAGDAYVIGDLPAGSLSDRWTQALARRVADGAGLLAIGGPLGFGRGGHASDAFARLLPVEVAPQDDRENVPSGLFVRRRVAHPVLDGLPWDQPPVVTSFHRFVPKAGAQVALEGARLLAIGAATASFAAKTSPLLVLGEHLNGRVAALATDLGGPWSAGWSCWGHAVRDGSGEELGSSFLRFVTQLVSFVARTTQADPWTSARLQAVRPPMVAAMPTSPTPNPWPMPIPVRAAVR